MAHSFQDCGKRIRAYRKLKRVTQAELARRLHVSPSVIGVVERGTRAPSPELLEDIAKELDIDIRELTGEKERGDPSWL